MIIIEHSIEAEEYAFEDSLKNLLENKISSNNSIYIMSTGSTNEEEYHSKINTMIVLQIDNQITQEALYLCQLFPILASSPTMNSTILDSITEKITSSTNLDTTTFTYENRHWDNESKMKLRSFLSQVYTNRNNMNKLFLSFFGNSGFSDVVLSIVDNS